MKCFITGISGFAGSHLAELLLNKGYIVFGSFRKIDNLDNIAHIANKLKLYELDILDNKKLKKAIADAQPDFVFHLAAQPSVSASLKAPNETKKVNVEGTRNLLESISTQKVLIVGSGDQYGPVSPEDMPIKESHSQTPTNPYGESKKLAEELALEYYREGMKKVVITRSFNHTGPRQAPSFVCSDWSKQIAEIEAGKKEPTLQVGSLQVKKDFSDVRDVVQAYLLLMEMGTPGEVYNVCSGKGIKLRYILETLIGFSRVNIGYRVDANKVRKIYNPVYFGDNLKIRKLGWKPSYKIEQTLHDTLEYWRSKVV